LEVLSHRGYWKSITEKNSESAFRRSFQLGFGTETDVRDLNGELVISHDMPLSEIATLSLNNFLNIYSEYQPLPLALNIKSDGLQKSIQALLKKHAIDNYVLFDMSVPDQIVTAKHKLKHLTRASEYEAAVMLDVAEGVWADEFYDNWINAQFISGLSHKNKAVYIVSPELHARNHLPRWKDYKSMGLQDYSHVYLCTDLPEQAKAFFEV